MTAPITQDDLAEARKAEYDADQVHMELRSTLDFVLEILEKLIKWWRKAQPSVRQAMLPLLFEEKIGWTKQAGYGNPVTTRAVKGSGALDGSCVVSGTP